MKKMKKLVALLLAAAMSAALASCGGSNTGSDVNAGSDTGAGDAGTAAPTSYSDTLVIGDNTEPKNLDPDQSWGAAEARFSAFIHEGLVREDENGSIIPLLATDWTVSDDGLTYTFNLKEGVKFSDGTDVTVADWAWSLYRARDCEYSNSRSVAAKIDTVTGSDEDHTLVITLTEPQSCFLANLCKWNMVVLSEAHYNEVGEEAFLRDPLGTGPYAVTEWKQGEYIQCAANEYYHVEGQPYTKNLTYKIITDDNTRLLQLQSGDIDIMGIVPTNMMETVASDSNLTAAAFNGSQIRFLILNCSDDVLSNEKVREALYYAMDKQQIVDFVAAGYAKPVASYVNEIHGDLYDADLKDADRDVEKAKELLAEAGYANGLDLTINITSGNTIYENVATILQAQWAEAGITLSIEPLESATLVQNLGTFDYQLTLLQWTDSTPDPNDISAYECNYADSYQWYSGVDDTAMDETYAKSATATGDERVELMHQLQQMVFARKNIIPLFAQEWTYGYSNKVEGIKVTPFNKINVAEIRVAE